MLLNYFNEMQEPLFIGFCDSESELNSTLAHWNIKQRQERMGKPKPTNAIDDGCCNSHHKTVRLDTGVYVNIWGMERPGRKDPFHFMQLGGRCLVPANKKDATVWRAKVVERLRAIIWEDKDNATGLKEGRRIEIASTVLHSRCSLLRFVFYLPLPNSTLGRVGGGGTGNTVQINHSGLACFG